MKISLTINEALQFNLFLETLQVSNQCPASRLVRKIEKILIKNGCDKDQLLEIDINPELGLSACARVAAQLKGEPGNGDIMVEIDSTVEHFLREII